MKKVMKAVAALMLMTAVVFAVGCTKSDDSNNGDNNNEGGNQDNHEYVDLGLPSGTLWATCNVGAETPEGYGDYFAWGETQPKDTYNWNTYKYCNGDKNTLTKYCTNDTYGYNGFYDGFTVLFAADDAATENWTDDWVTPTKGQWKELFDNTTSIWTMQNDVKGRLFTATNGCSLFLPAAGRLRADEEDDLVGDLGGYMSSTLKYSDANWAWIVAFNSYGRGMDECLRFIGVSVRPVRSAK